MNSQKNILNKYYIEISKKEYEALPEDEWMKQWFCELSGGFVASHVLKAVDDLTRNGIVAEVRGCMALAEMGKHVLRLPENIPNLLDEVVIDGKPYPELLKYKIGETKPRGYPDVYFDGETWDFKVTSSENIDTIRQLIKDGRKADNVIFMGLDEEKVKSIEIAMERELGREKKNGTWMILPSLHYLIENQLISIWLK